MQVQGPATLQYYVWKECDAEAVFAVGKEGINAPVAVLAYMVCTVMSAHDMTIMIFCGSQFHAMWLGGTSIAFQL